MSILIDTKLRQQVTLAELTYLKLLTVISGGFDYFDKGCDHQI